MSPPNWDYPEIAKVQIELAIDSDARLDSNKIFIGYEGTGTVTMNDGSVNLNSVYVGYGQTGLFEMSGGTATLGYLSVGWGGEGTFTLNGGTVDVREYRIDVGGAGTGQFNLNGGLVIADEFTVNSNGTFSSDSGGTLRVNSLSFEESFSLDGNLQFGHYGGGGPRSYSLDGDRTLSVSDDLIIEWLPFTQSGGANLTSDYLRFRRQYRLEGGHLSANVEDVDGAFWQTGGTNSIGDKLEVANIEPVGEYHLIDGQLIATNEYIGLQHEGEYGATGTFIHSGGTNSVANILHLKGGTELWQENWDSTADYSIYDGELDVSNGVILVESFSIFGTMPSANFALEGGRVVVDQIVLLNVDVIGIVIGIPFPGVGFSSNGMGTLCVNSVSGFGNTVALDGTLQIGHSGGTGSADWTLNVAVSNDMTLGYDAPATLTHTTRTNTIGGRLLLGEKPGSTGTYNFSNGILRAGSIQQGDGTADFNWTGGTLHVGSFGSSAKSFDLSNGGQGILAPGNSVGTTTVYGDYTQGPDATLAIEMDASGADQLVVNGDVDLAGTLDVHAVGNLGSWGDATWSIVTASGPTGITGTFDDYPSEGDYLGRGVFHQAVAYDASNVDLTVFQAAPGDCDLDRDVDISDIMDILAAGKFGDGPSDATWFEGNNDDDEDVDSGDIQNILAAGLFGAGPYASGSLDTREGAAQLLLTADGLLLDTGGVTLNGYILNSQNGIFTGDAADNLGLFTEDTDDLIGGNFAFTLNGTHLLGRVIGQAFEEIDLLGDLTLTYTLAGQGGIYTATVVIPEPDTLLMLTAATMALLCWRRRRARSLNGQS